MKYKTMPCFGHRLARALGTCPTFIRSLDTKWTWASTHPHRPRDKGPMTQSSPKSVGGQRRVSWVPGKRAQAPSGSWYHSRGPWEVQASGRALQGTHENTEAQEKELHGVTRQSPAQPGPGPARQRLPCQEEWGQWLEMARDLPQSHCGGEEKGCRGKGTSVQTLPVHREGRYEADRKLLKFTQVGIQPQRVQKPATAREPPQTP